MIVYRIAKLKKRATDLSGMGAYKEGGRWNNAGTYMLYTSENSSLAYLENLVHFEIENTPPNLYIMSIGISADDALIYTLPDKIYPESWRETGNLQNKIVGDQLMEHRKFLAIKIRSAINKLEYNYLLNPLFPGYHDLVKIRLIEELAVDARLVK
ncbi:RES domain-containing protein [Pedobacter cryoconitis]|uniref:RES domain-containing protein n=1 Tax=Pedobacter cryoconitis TaxID=188932 RepID=A0A7W9DZL5_9SPHI|nr:RES family NAD+ phosphorylase [Pedobacter cryoconitis]MBB5637477.1 RES domain-containing protein [Pedobacter cryoconitis]